MTELLKPHSHLTLTAVLTWPGAGSLSALLLV